MAISLEGRRLSWVVIAYTALVYAAVYFLLDSLTFSPRKDELHFWPTSVSFSHAFPPSVERLRNYDDLNTPLPFVIYGALEHFLHRGIWLPRLFNLALSFAVLLAILFARGKTVTAVSIRCAAALLLCPYFLGVSTHVYTDIVAVGFAVLGLALASSHKNVASAFAFALAIASRQYAVAFPAALFVVRAHDAHVRQRLWKEYAGWLFPALAACTLTGWFLFFGGPGPRDALARQIVETASWGSLLPANAGYFLATLGFYFVGFELLLFAEAREKLIATLDNHKRVAVLLVLTLGYFSLFPPLGNPASYPFTEMGFLDKALRLAGSDSLRVAALGLLAFLTLLRFSSITFEGVLVFIYAALMIKAHIAWDKYALLPLVAMWWLKAGGYLSSYVSNNRS